MLKTASMLFLQNSKKRASKISTLEFKIVDFNLVIGSINGINEHGRGSRNRYCPASCAFTEYNEELLLEGESIE